MKNFFYSKTGFAFLVFSLCLVVSCGSDASDSAGAAVTDITIYQSDASYFPVNIPNRADSTTECESTHQNNPSWGVSCSNYVALLAFNADNGVQDLPANFNVPTNLAVYTPDGVVPVADDFADLIAARDFVMTGDGFWITDAWTGFQNGGAVLANCNNYTSTSNLEGMNRAQLNFTGNWASGNVPCDSSIAMPVLCLCW